MPLTAAVAAVQREPESAVAAPTPRDARSWGRTAGAEVIVAPNPGTTKPCPVLYNERSRRQTDLVAKHTENILIRTRGCP